MTRLAQIEAATVLSVLLCLAGCQHMRNADIIDETKRCEAAGLRAEPIQNIDGIIVGIQCRPKVEP